MIYFRNIFTFIIATVIFSACSVQQRYVEDELYQDPGSVQAEEQVFSGYYDEAGQIVEEESLNITDMDSVSYGGQEETYRNPYDEILIDDYEEAYQRRINASSSLSYGMSDWYTTYFSDDFWYASAYDPSLYNVIVMGNQIWVEPKWLTNHFGTGWNYGSFYNYPYHGNSMFNPYRSTLSMTGIYGFNTMGYGVYGYNAFGFGSTFGSGYYGYGSYGFSPYGYSPYGYSSYAFGPYGYSSYFSLSDYYNFGNQKRLKEELELNEEGRLKKYSINSKRIRRPDKGNNNQKRSNSKTYIRVKNDGNTSSKRSVHSVRTRSTGEKVASKYVRTRSENTASNRPKYNRPHNEPQAERLLNRRSSSYSNRNHDNGSRKSYNTNRSSRSHNYNDGYSNHSTRTRSSSSSSSTYKSNGSTRSSGSSVRSGGGSRSSRSSSSSSSSGRKR